MLSITIEPTGVLEANTIVIRTDRGTAIVDPGGPEAVRLIEGSLDYILLTHGHIDHIAGTAAVKERFPQARILIGSADLPLYRRFDLQARLFMLPAPDELPEPDDLLRGGEDILGLRVIHAPGHSPGSMVFYHPEGILISGDVLFREGVGRTDLWEGSWDTLLESIRNIMKYLPPETRVLPGHGPETTLKWELEHNPFLR